MGLGRHTLAPAVRAGFRFHLDLVPLGLLDFFLDSLASSSSEPAASGGSRLTVYTTLVAIIRGSSEKDRAIINNCKIFVS